MKKILKPYWLFLTVTIPQVFLFAVFYRVYDKIGTGLSDVDRQYWLIYGVVLGAMLLIFTAYALCKQIKKREVTKLDAIAILVAYIAVVYALIYNYRKIIPASIPSWMFFDMNPLLVIAICFMPMMLYCIMACVVLFAPKQGYKLWKDIVIAMAIPLFFYILVQVINNVLFSWFDYYSDFIGHFFMVLVVAASVIFMFLAMRIILYLFNKKKRSWRIVSIIVGLVLPLAGLLLNQFAFFQAMGDYSSIYFYIVAVLTGVLFIFPEFKNIKARLVVFFLKSVCFSYTIYFFITFMPFIPLALILTIALGLGFLLMAPTLLLIVHTRSLAEDFKAIKSHTDSKRMIYSTMLIFFVGILVIPTCVTVTFLKDRYTINKSLEYVFEAGYEQEYQVKISQSSLRRTMKNIESNSKEGDWLEVYPNTPYINSFYNKIVLDNAIISENKMNLLRKVFLDGEQDISMTSDTRLGGSSKVVIQDYQVETTYDDEQGYYKSWLHLDIENTGDNGAQYSTNFTLPTGCYISDYYLYVGSEKKIGLITDKRAANWIYNQIVRVRRDPGILTYLKDDLINFRVFPFTSGEVRKTGIEFVHVEPIELLIDDNSVELGGEKTVNEIIRIGDSIVYIPASVKDDLPLVKRIPQYNFIIDCSKSSEGKTSEYVEAVDSFAKQHGIYETDVTYYMTNYNLQKKCQRDDLLEGVECDGGFFADRAIKTILFDNYRNNENTYPVIIVVADDSKSAVLMDDYDDIEFMFPDSEYIYFMSVDSAMFSYSLLSKETNIVTFENITDNQNGVFTYPDKETVKSYLSKDNKSSLVLTGSINQELLQEYYDSKWQTGAVLDAMNRDLNLRTGDRNKKSLDIIKGSIRSRVMTPLSSFIVLETQEQEKALLEKQKRLLASEKQYLSDAQLTDMSEPSFLILVVILIVFLANSYKKDKSIQTKCTY